MRFTVILAIAAILTPAALSARTVAPQPGATGRDRSLGGEEKEEAREAEGGIPQGRARHRPERAADEVLAPPYAG